MSCNCNYNCTTVKDFLKCIWIENVSCKSKVCEFNSIMRKFYLDIYSLDFNRTVEPFVWSGNIEIITDYPVYKLIGIFGKEDCNSCWCNACLLDVPTCEWWCSCQAKLKQVMHQTWDDNNLKTWEYTQWYKCISANIPSCFSDWYIVYQRWPKLFSWLDENLCLPDELLVALEYLSMHEYAIKDKQFEAAQFYSQMYQQVLKKLNDKDATVPFAVGRWADMYWTNVTHNVWK